MRKSISTTIHHYTNEKLQFCRVVSSQVLQCKHCYVCRVQIVHFFCFFLPTSRFKICNRLTFYTYFNSICLLFCFYLPCFVTDKGVLMAPVNNSPDAPGEMGRPVILPTNMSTEMKKSVDDGWMKNAFNQYASDLISIHRSLPDPRDPW